MMSPILHLQIPVWNNCSILDAFIPKSAVKNKEVKFKSYKEIHTMKITLLDRVVDGKGLRVEIPAGTKPEQVSRLLRVLAGKIDQARFTRIKEEDQARLARAKKEGNGEAETRY